MITCLTLNRLCRPGLDGSTAGSTRPSSGSAIACARSQWRQTVRRVTNVSGNDLSHKGSKQRGQLHKTDVWGKSRTAAMRSSMSAAVMLISVGQSGMSSALLYDWEGNDHGLNTRSGSSSRASPRTQHARDFQTVFNFNSKLLFLRCTCRDANVEQASLACMWK